MGTKPKRKKVNWVIIIVVSLLLATSAWITIAPKLGFPFETITWDDIFIALKLREPPLPDTDWMTFVDVGQGDCTVVHSGGKTAVIDAGEPDKALKVTRYLQEQRVESIELLIGTHPHADHIGGLIEVLRQFSVKTLALPDARPKEQSDLAVYEELLSLAQEKKVSIVHPVTGDSFAVGTFLGTYYLPATTEDENDNTLLITLQKGDFSALLLADASKSAEKELLEMLKLQNITLLKIGHHGSATSTSDALLKTIKPQNAVISVGANNSYGHPTGEVLERLQRYRAHIYRTDQNGCITVTGLDKELTITPERGKGT